MSQGGRPKGRRVPPETMSALADWMAPLPPRRDLLLEHLHVLQDRFAALHAPHLAALAQWLGISQAEVYEVASFYHHFEWVAEGEAVLQADDSGPARLKVRVCVSQSCQMAAGDRDLSNWQQRLQAVTGRPVQVHPVPCLGRCDQAPVVQVHQNPLPHADFEQVLQCVREPGAWTPAPHSTAVWRRAYPWRHLQSLRDGRAGLEWLCEQWDTAGVRGMGGAGFPVGRKWRTVAAQAGPRLMVVNLDEGEPGTFKDRVALEENPHRFWEGLLLAARSVAVEKVYVYVRDEYPALRQALQWQWADMQAHPPLGLPLPELEIRRGAGAYVCGEESSLMASIEGLRPLPRMRPPFVAQRGLWGRPTLSHNGETLLTLIDILEMGAQKWRDQGRRGRPGLRRFSVSGRVSRAGCYLAPAGISLRELVDEFAGGMAPGHTLYAYLPGGASGGILPAALADLPLDFDTLQPHGAFIGSAAVVVLSQADRAVDAAREAARFMEAESCGQCSPCRLGTRKMNALIGSDRWDAAQIGALATLMKETSICGLGQAAPGPVECVLRYFSHELE